MTVTYSTEAKTFSFALFARAVSDDELAAAVGALDGAALEVRVSRGDELLVTINHPWIVKQARRFKRDRQGVLHLVNEHFEKRRDAPAGVGIESFRRQVEGARRMGIQRIELWAQGELNDTSYNGYYTWARFGFDAPLSIPEQEKCLRATGQKAASLNDLAENRQLHWWRAKGTARTMRFILDDDSRMMRIFKNYLKEKGLL
jgi:hypothetical protein